MAAYQGRHMPTPAWIVHITINFRNFHPRPARCSVAGSGVVLYRIKPGKDNRRNRDQWHSIGRRFWMKLPWLWPNHRGTGASRLRCPGATVAAFCPRLPVHYWSVSRCQPGCCDEKFLKKFFITALIRWSTCRTEATSAPGTLTGPWPDPFNYFLPKKSRCCSGVVAFFVANIISFTAYEQSKPTPRPETGTQFQTGEKTNQDQQTGYWQFKTNFFIKTETRWLKYYSQRSLRICATN